MTISVSPVQKPSNTAGGRLGTGGNEGNRVFSRYGKKQNSSLPVETFFRVSMVPTINSHRILLSSLRALLFKNVRARLMDDWEQEKTRVTECSGEGKKHTSAALLNVFHGLQSTYPFTAAVVTSVPSAASCSKTLRASPGDDWEQEETKVTEFLGAMEKNSTQACMENSSSGSQKRFQPSTPAVISSVFSVASCSKTLRASPGDDWEQEETKVTELRTQRKNKSSIRVALLNVFYGLQSTYPFTAAVVTSVPSAASCSKTLRASPGDDWEQEETKVTELRTQRKNKSSIRVALLNVFYGLQSAYPFTAAVVTSVPSAASCSRTLRASPGDDWEQEETKVTEFWT